MTYDTLKLPAPKTPFVVLLAIMAVSLGLHLGLISRLNIVEDESGYMQDAAQIRKDVLPFREFGGTKGPLFLFTLKFWQLLFGITLESSRMFSVIAHVLSIPPLYLFTRNITRNQIAAYAAAMFWGITPVIISLTTNVMHIPLELLLILIGVARLTSPRPYQRSLNVTVAFLFFLAVLTRATAIAFLPLLLVLLIKKADSWKPIILFGFVGIILVASTVTIIYPLYGWPKTAFFFNADATLIAGKQGAVYTSLEPTLGIIESQFRAALPAWREGIVMMLLALLLPFLWLAQKTKPFFALILWLTLVAGISGFLIQDIDSWWTKATYAPQWWASRITFASVTMLGLLAVMRARKLPSIPNHIIMIILIWISGFILFYKGWGRTPTPYYVLESLPAFAIAAALTTTHLSSLLGSIRSQLKAFTQLLALVALAILILNPYQAIIRNQYRGTITVAAAKEITEHINHHTPINEPLFTGQPVFAYLSGRPLYGGYTHPGWYLSERAGYLPAEIRRVFLPDFSQLTEQVQKEVNWIVLDWRTRDIYFNESTPATLPLREMLAQNFTAVTTVKNPASRDITLYRRH